MSFHDDVGFPCEAAVEAVEVQSGHPELATGVRLAASVRASEDFKVEEFDALEENKRC